MAKPSYSNADGYSPVDLVDYAADHFTAAMSLFGDQKGGHYDSAAYLGHLAIELLLKAWHLYELGTFPAVHRLQSLWDGLAERGVLSATTNQQRERIRVFDQFAEARYPNPDNPIEINESTRTLLWDLFTEIIQQMPAEAAQLRNDRQGFPKKGGRYFANIEGAGRGWHRALPPTSKGKKRAR